MAEIYKGYAIEYIDYRGDYRIFVLPFIPGLLIMLHPLKKRDK